MIAAILAGMVFALTDFSESELLSRSFWLLGGLLCQIRLLCNLFDGMVAIAQNKASPKGELYNEVPDRVSDVTILIGLGFGFAGTPFVGAIELWVKQSGQQTISADRWPSHSEWLWLPCSRLSCALLLTIGAPRLIPS